MTVLVCIPCLLTGGTEIQTLNLVQALVAGGHRVITVCYYEYDPGTVSRYQKAGSEVILLSPSGIRYRGIRQIFFLYSGLRKAVRSFCPDAAHVQYMAPGALPVLLLRLLGVKNILATSHTAADIYPRLGLLHFVQRHGLRAFLCVTRRAEESFFGDSRVYAPDYPWKKRNHFTLYNALSPLFAVSGPARKFGRTLTIGVVSRLERIKGMDLVIPAFARLREQGVECRLLIVGDGSLRAEMEARARAAGLVEKVEWRGSQPQEALPALYDQMDVFWMPSRSEGFGLSALEAMSRGCVVVAARVGGLPEVVREEETGCLHLPESIGDLADKTRILLEEEEKRMLFSRRAEEVAREFCFGRFCSLVNDVYEKVGK